MPKPSWEASNNNAFYGYLKFLDFQNNGYDLHVTFQKNKRVHVSIYVLGGAKIFPPGNIWMVIETYGLKLPLGGGQTIKNKVSPSSPLPSVPGYSSYPEFFMAENNAKAVELGIIAPKPQPKPTTVSFTISDFPPLGS